MKKRHALAALVFSLLLFFPMTRVFATSARVIDDAQLFTDEEEQILEAQADAISRTYDTDVWIYTSLDSVAGSDNYARDLIEFKGEMEHPDGYIAYAVDMADRSYWVDAYGTKEREIFTQSKTDSLADDAKDHLRDGEYYESAKGFLDSVEKRLMYKTDPMGRFKKPFIYWKTTLLFLGVSLAGGLVVAGIMTAVKSSKHKDKKLARQADAYSDNLNLRVREDRFVRAYQTRVKVESESSGGGGGFSGGGSSGHTGSGGHF